jgi:hypothetical protein
VRALGVSDAQLNAAPRAQQAALKQLVAYNEQDQVRSHRPHDEMFGVG